MAYITEVELELTKDEIDEREKWYFDKYEEKEAKEAEFDLEKEKYKNELKGMQSDLDKLRAQITSGKAEFECEIQFHTPHNGEKTIIRKEDGKQFVQMMTDLEIDNYSQSDMFE
jgi:hypothetical protein